MQKIDRFRDQYILIEYSEIIDRRHMYNKRLTVFDRQKYCSRERTNHKYGQNNQKKEIQKIIFIK